MKRLREFLELNFEGVLAVSLVLALVAVWLVIGWPW